MGGNATALLFYQVRASPVPRCAAESWLLKKRELAVSGDALHPRVHLAFAAKQVL
jgi:hypothetical protein